MAYNTFNALVIGFCPGDRASEAILSIALYPRWVNLYFLDGVGALGPLEAPAGKRQPGAEHPGACRTEGD